MRVVRGPMLIFVYDRNFSLMLDNLGRLGHSILKLEDAGPDNRIFGIYGRGISASHDILFVVDKNQHLM